MILLSVSDAVELVRKNLDELDPNGNASVMYTDENDDNVSLTNTIKRFLPEAINAVHLAAPVELLEGRTVQSTDISSASITTGGVLNITLADTVKFLRLVAFQAADSALVVTDVIGEATPEGRKQLNPHICGRYDRPRLVQGQGKHTGPVFRYYSLNSDGDNYASYESSPVSAVSRIDYIEEMFYAAGATAYNISRMLRQNIVDELTAKVMETYSDQRAELFHKKAQSF